MAINYSKWNNIEVSDDEDDTHPNIDTPSLFKWRHEARIERMKEFEVKKKQTNLEFDHVKQKKSELKEKLEKAKKNGDELTSLKKSLEELENDDLKVEEKMRELEKEQRLQPWNVDTLSSEGFSKVVVNKAPPSEKKELTDEEKEEKMKAFIKDHKKEMEEYGMFSKLEDSKKYLMERKHLCCEETANYLVLQCINYAMEEKFSLMDHVAHQVIAMQFLLDLAKQLEIDPRACISSFFSKFQKSGEEYKKTFNNELDAFKERIRKRAKEKLEELQEEAKAEIEEEANAEDLIGPGGLYPADVFKTLPECLQKCFESQDIELLQKTIKELPSEEAHYHMKRCVDSGLWAPAKGDPNTNPENGFARNAGEASSGDEEEKGEKPSEAS